MTTPITPTEDIYCADASQAADAPLFGTAAQAETWLLLEYSGPWRARAVTDNDLPDVVQQWLDDQSQRLPNSRILFIKRDDSKTTPTVRFFVARTTEDDQRLFQWTLNAYDQLFDIDLAGVIAGTVSAESTSDPLLLVCTNGKRDRCCARFGIGVYHALHALAPEATWQATHIGGHRYAATAALLPAGVYYGYLAPSDAADLLHETAQHRLRASAFRGRTFYEPPVQAADHFLRHTTGNWQFDAQRCLSATADGDVWRVVFATADGARYAVTLAAETGPTELASCGPAKHKPAPRFRFLTHTLE